MNKPESLISPSIDNLLTKVENKYVLALLAARRARELFDGSDQCIDDYFSSKVTVAINEIDRGKVSYTHGGEPTEDSEISADEPSDADGGEFDPQGESGDGQE